MIEQPELSAMVLNNGSLLVTGFCQVCNQFMIQECVLVTDQYSRWWPASSRGYPVFQGKPICDDCMAEVEQALEMINGTHGDE